MKNPRFIFWFILLLILVAIFIDLPNNITIFGKRFVLHPDFFIGNTHIKKDFSFRRGLDLEGGVSITYKANMDSIPTAQQADALESAKTVIERRVNLFGVSEPVVQTATVNKQSRIIVEMPGITNVDEALQLIGTTAQLTFWEGGSASNAASTKKDLASQASSSAYPLGLTQVFENPKKTNLTGKDLQHAGVAFNPNTGAPEVSLVFTEEGGKKFADITKRNISKPLAIVLDNITIQAPVVNTVIADGNAVISGGFTTEQAKNISIQLNAGALPISLSVLEQSRIGPTLGENSLQMSLVAGGIGILVIIFFMIALYGRFGVVASLALLVYTLFVIALFKLIPITLTLAGIAGFILSIGMAVDANILIFERMREELRSRKSIGVALELGFSRAWTSIRDSNVSSLITSVILYQFGTGPVRGFAVTLAIGVLVSMFSAIMVTRTFLRILYK